MKKQPVWWAAGLILASLVVASAQPVIETQPVGQTVVVGASVTLTVVATGNEPLSYQWYFISPANPIPGATSATLVLNDVQVSNAGNYRVNISDSEGSIWSVSALITVILPPTITLQPANQTGQIGQSAIFRTSLSGGAPLSYQWRFNSAIMESQTNDFLVLNNLQIQQLGAYTLVVTNISGSVTSQVATLSLLATVNPPFDPGLTIAWDNDQLTVSWAGEGVLDEALTSNGPWNRIPTTNSTITFQPTIPGAFYRVQNPNPRPVNVFLPSSYNPQTPLPLLILLHGYTSGSVGIENYMRLQPLAESRGFLYCKPQGTGSRTFWNATDACCNFVNSRVDDVAYLTSLIHEIQRTWNPDPKRIHMMGHSNGGFMSFRMACEQSPLIASIASLAGATWFDSNDCQPSEPVSILQIHGTADTVISYNGGSFLSGAMFPSAQATIAAWSGYNGCDDPETEAAPSMDLDLARAGLDSRVTRYNIHPSGGAVELWTIDGGAHSPTFFSGTASSEFSSRTVDWLLAHPKP